MNKAALRRILAEEGLLPQKKVASKALARMFTDFYRGISRDLGPDAKGVLNVRKAVHADLKEIMDGLKYVSATVEGAVDYDYTEVYETNVEIDPDGLDEDIGLPKKYRVIGTLSVEPPFFSQSYLWDFRDELYDLDLISTREWKEVGKKWMKAWGAFIHKVMESKDFQQALLKRVSRWQEEAHMALYNEVEAFIESEIKHEYFNNDGSRIDYYPSIDHSYMDVRAELVGVSRSGASVDYTFKFTGTLDAKAVVDEMKFSWKNPGPDYDYY